MSKLKFVLRWASVIPVIFSIVFLVDWSVKFAFFWIELPISFFGTGYVGDFFDSISTYFFKIDSVELVKQISISLLTGYMLLYVLSLILPTDKKKNSKVLAIILLIGLLAGLVLELISGYFIQLILIPIPIIVGVIIARRSLNIESFEDLDKKDKWIQKNVIIIFILTLSFAVLMCTLLYS